MAKMIPFVWGDGGAHGALGETLPDGHTGMPLRAFHNDPAVKAFYVARVRAHRVADQVVHGVYWQRGKGCAVGCSVHGAFHGAYETKLGIPCILAHLEESIFESLSAPEDCWWPERFLDAIPVGADLSRVWPHFVVALLSDAAHGFLQYVTPLAHPQEYAALRHVLQLHTHWATTGQRPETATATAAADAAHAATAMTTSAAVHAAALAACAFADVAGGLDAEGHVGVSLAAESFAVVAGADASRVDATPGAVLGGDAAYQAAACWHAQLLLRLLRDAPVAGARAVARLPWGAASLALPLRPVGWAGEPSAR